MNDKLHLVHVVVHTKTVIPLRVSELVNMLGNLLGGHSYKKIWDELRCLYVHFYSCLVLQQTDFESSFYHITNYLESCIVI